jgi:glutamate-1-semialdehyde 2,1-aminomutase
MMDSPFAWYVAGFVACSAAAPFVWRRLQLSLAKHPSLGGHARMAKTVAALVPGYTYDGDRFFAADRATAATVARRRAGLARLAEVYRSRYGRSTALTEEARAGLSDLQFTSSYRVPFQFSRYLRQHLKFGSFVAASRGPTVTDLDGNVFFDVSGAYGVNLFGYDLYKHCIAEGARRVEALGPVLGAYHPCVADNVARLRALSGLDEVSFHMSGTEAVMQAVRLARYHTRRKHLVRFSGAYHGWWDDVQPGPGNPSAPRNTYTLKEMHADTLRVLATRRDIACVLINPVQALHPNASPPSDAALVGSSRRAGFDRAAYTEWLRELRRVCSARGIVLIFDEVMVGFRLARGGAQEYFGVQADLVTYGKTVAGGLPIGVLCGRAEFMKRFRDDRPADVCLARGTFNSHPYVMGAMNVFLEELDAPAQRAVYAGLNVTWDARAARFNEMLAAHQLPVRGAHLSSIWTVVYLVPSRYNWMLQFYLRAEGLALSWVGTGRLIFSLDYSDSEFAEVTGRFVRAAQAMRIDGWWDAPAPSDKSIRRELLLEMVRQRL